MNLETVLLAKAWLQHEKYGINALLPSIPRVKGHVEPKPVQVYADLDDDVYVEGLLVPAKRPAVVLLIDTDTAIDLGKLSADVAMGMRFAAVYVTGDEADVRGRRDGAYTARAIRRSLRAWHKYGTDADKELLGVRMVEVRRVVEVIIGNEALHLWGGVLADMIAMDKQP